MAKWTCNSMDRVSVFGTESRGSSPFKSTFSRSVGVFALVGLFFISPVYSKETSAQMRNTAGLALYYQGRYAEAFEEFLGALRQDPNNKEAHFNLGRIFEKQGKFEDAFQQYRRTLALDPTHMAAKDGYERLRRFERKVEIRVKTREELLEDQVRQAEKTPQSERAAEELLQNRLAQIQKLFDSREYETAREVIERNRNLFPGSGELNFLLARYYYVKGEHSSASELCSRALSLGVKEEDVVHYLKALSHEALGDFTSAEDELRQALRLAPSNSVYYERLGIVQRRLGKEVDAWEQFKRGVEVNPGAIETRMQFNRLSRELSLKTYTQGRLAFERRDYRTAESLLGRAIEFGQLPDSEKEEAGNLLGMTRYWVAKERKVDQIKEVQFERTQEINLTRELTFDEVRTSNALYAGRYVSWAGIVLKVEQKSGYYEILVDTKTNFSNDTEFQEDLQMHTMFLVRVNGKIPDDKRLSYLGRAEIKGKVKEPVFIRNPFNKNLSARKQPVIMLTEGRFENRNFGSGFLRVFPEAKL